MSASKSISMGLYVLAAVIAAMLVRFVLYAPFGHDEIEHAHVAWRLLQGDLPYADFHQNHAPAVWWVGAAALTVLPHTANAVLALRCLAFGTFLVSMALGWRLLRQLAPDVSATIYPLALIGMLCLSYRLEWFRFRPDPFMSLLVTLALVVITGGVTHRRAAATGVLLAVAASFSPKVWPLLGLLPLRLGFDACRVGIRRPLTQLASYVAGGIIGILPLAGWLLSQGLLPEFLREVLAFNGAYPKPPADALRFLARPLLLAALAGAGLMVWHAWRRLDTNRWPYIALALGIVLGFSAVFFGVHAAVYNQQAAAIPAALAFAFLGASLAGRHASGVRLILLSVFLTVCIRREVTGIVTLYEPDWTIEQQEMSQFLDVTRATPGGRCVAFAPCDPVFCENPVEPAILWDLLFLEHPDPAFKARHQTYWKAAADEVIRSRPDVVVAVCDGVRPWDRAAAAGAFDRDTLDRLHAALANGYDLRTIGQQQIWVAR
ncbi:MAG: hypothetical protein AB7J63_17790 [Vicinamibacterales bacterium]